MKTHKYLLFPIILFLVTSCYIYKPYTEKEVEEMTQNNNSAAMKVKSIRNSDADGGADASRATKGLKGSDLQKEAGGSIDGRREGERQKQDEKQKQEQEENAKVEEEQNQNSNKQKDSFTR